MTALSGMYSNAIVACCAAGDVDGAEALMDGAWSAEVPRTVAMYASLMNAARNADDAVSRWSARMESDGFGTPIEVRVDGPAGAVGGHVAAAPLVLAAAAARAQLAARAGGACREGDALLARVPLVVRARRVVPAPDVLARALHEGALHRSARRRLVLPLAAVVAHLADVP